MNTIISFEIAKMLKEKGVILSAKNFYPKPKCKLFGIDEHGRHYQIVNKTKAYLKGKAAVLKAENYYDAPTIAEVVMWLYEKHLVWINVGMGNEGFNCAIDYKSFKASEFILACHPTPNEAYESAIKYVLTNLI